MTKQEAKKRIDQLKEELRRHDYNYHVLDKPEISDAAWDSLKKELADIERQFPECVTSDSPTQRVRGTPLEKFQKVEHRVRQWSLQDAFSEDELTEWEARNLKLLQKHDPSIRKDMLDYMCELKIDGLHIVCTYEKGILHTAATRGDGVVGEEVTHNVRTIASVPLKLKQDANMVVEGEVWMSKRELNRINTELHQKGKEPFANPRNAAAGSIRQLDPKVAASRRLNAFMYDLSWKADGVLPKTQHDELSFLRGCGFVVEPHAVYAKSLQEVSDFLEKWEKKHDALAYLVDGMVIKINGRRFQEILGYTGKAPRFAIAFKFPAEEATTIVDDIVVQVGRLGKLTPVAHLRPVIVAGSCVSRATLNNQAYIDKLDVRKGDTVIIRKAGDIIPQVIRVLLGLRKKGAQSFAMPKNCPFCKKSIHEDKTGESILHFCTNTRCPARGDAGLIHFVSKKGFNIEGLGDKIIERFKDEGLVVDASDIFYLQKGDIETLTGFGEKSAVKLLKNIEKSKHIRLSKFLYALGIAHIGERMAHSLARCIEGRIRKKNFTLTQRPSKLAGLTKKDTFVWGFTVRDVAAFLQKISPEDLQAIPDFGPKAAESVHAWFNVETNQTLLSNFDSAGITFVRERIKGTFDGKVFVFTGSLQTLSRDEAKELVTSLGGVVLEAVSKNMDYVVAGQNPGTKLKRAKQLGVRIITEDEFLRLVNKKEVV